MIDPREIRAAGEKVDKKTITEAMLATNDAERIISAVEKFDRLGFDIVEVASLSPDQEGFMKLYKDKVMTQFQ
jgi:hypothetical protein